MNTKNTIREVTIVNGPNRDAIVRSHARTTPAHEHLVEFTIAPRALVDPENNPEGERPFFEELVRMIAGEGTLYPTPQPDRIPPPRAIQSFKFQAFVNDAFDLRQGFMSLDLFIPRKGRPPEDGVAVKIREYELRRRSGKVELF